MTKRVRCECGKTLFLVDENVLEIKCPRSGHVTTIGLTPNFQPPPERRPRRAAGKGEGNVEPRERRDRQEGLSEGGQDHVPDGR